MFFHRHWCKLKLRSTRWGHDSAKRWHPWSCLLVCSPQGWCSSGGRCCRERFCPPGMLSPTLTEFTLLFLLFPVSQEELSWNFPSRSFFSRKYNFWGRGRWCLFCSFNWEKKLPCELEARVALINRNIFRQMEQHWHIISSWVSKRSLSTGERNQIILLWLPHTRENFPTWASLIGTSMLSHEYFRV